MIRPKYVLIQYHCHDMLIYRYIVASLVTTHALIVDAYSPEDSKQDLDSKLKASDQMNTLCIRSLRKQ